MAKYALDSSSVFFYYFIFAKTLFHQEVSPSSGSYLHSGLGRLVSD